MTFTTKISPFDVAAETYDADFTQSQIGQMQRARVWQLLMPVLQSYTRPLKILEINCGTGEDAIQLAKLGHHVTATDASEQMIRRAREKTRDSNIKTNQPHFFTCSYDQLPDYDFNESFDLVISNFGGLNCVNEKEIRKLQNSLSNLVSSDGKLLLVVLGKCCLWEMAYYSVKGKFHNAFRRWKRSVLFSINEHKMEIFYYSPSDIIKLFKPAFSRQQLEPVGLFIPPSYLESMFLKHSCLLQTLNRWEQKFSFPALSFLADHYCVIMNKNKP